MRINESDTVEVMGRKGLVIAFPGHRWRPLRKRISAEFRRNMCGQAVFSAIYDGLCAAGYEPRELGARPRLALIRLAVRLVGEGPADRCMCARCKRVRNERYR